MADQWAGTSPDTGRRDGDGAGRAEPRRLASFTVRASRAHSNASCCRRSTSSLAANRLIMQLYKHIALYLVNP